MTEFLKASAQVIQELGILAFLILLMALAFIYLVWRIVMAQDKIVVNQVNMAQLLAVHDQRSSDMYNTCKIHGEQLVKLTDVVSDQGSKISVLEALARR